MFKLFRVVTVAVCFAVLTSALFGKDQGLQTADVIAKHLASIGSPEARAAAKSRTLRGSVVVRVLHPGTGSAEGTAFLVSVDRRFSIAAHFSNPDFPGEQFVFDGSKPQVALVGPAERSILGDFFYRQDQILRDGLLGGSMLTSWTLLDVKPRQASLKYEGLKKIDGLNLHDIVYVPKKADRDLLIHLYFEPETFRHVKTVYEFTAVPNFSHNQLQHGETRRYRVEENFSDFRTVDGLTLPFKWTMRWTLSTSRTTESEWQVSVTSVQHNNVVD